MAALSHLRNKKESKLRDGIDKIMVKCGAGTQDSVNAASYLDVMHTYNIALDKKEISKINKITDEAGYISREDFIEHAKKSGAVKELNDKGFAVMGKQSASHSGPKKEVDKAELAFKAIDKDNSGSIDASELSKLGGGNMSKEKLDKLMAKLDTDGDGKITLEEFRGLFKQMK